ncbi:MAG TPA: hypothetical protein VNL17_10565 [Verrucomicrobiae bacterium]|nr:hypothetical protein [Verrucomicrobiae bacterium]
MSRCSKRSILSHWHSTISGTAACLSCWSAVPAATAQNSESPFLMASLSISTIPVESVRSNVSERTHRVALPECEPQSMLAPQRKPTDIEAWERFEAEYSPPQKSSSSVKRQIQAAKYGLDTAVFAVDRFVKSVENQADFSFDQGGLRHTRATSSGVLLNNVRVKLDLDTGQGSKPYVGVRIIIPFGH